MARTKQVGVSISPEIRERIEAWRMAQVVPPTMSSAVAALVRIGLETVEQEAES